MDSQDIASRVIEIAGSARERAQAVSNAIGHLPDAPPELEENLLQTQITLRNLTTRLEYLSRKSEGLPSLLQQLELSDPLETIRNLCEEFQGNIDGASLPDLSIYKFNTELNACHQTFNSVLLAVNLIISIQANEDHFDSIFKDQERNMSYTIEHIVQGSRVLKTSRQESRILGQLQDLCRRTTAATQASHSKQTFGRMQLDKSWGMQGIVGEAQRGVEQTFGDMNGTEHARGFQGQIDPASFAHMFTPQPRR